MNKDIHRWYKEWGEFKVQEQLYNRRPAYQNNEIVSLFSKKINENKKNSSLNSPAIVSIQASNSMQFEKY